MQRLSQAPAGKKFEGGIPSFCVGTFYVSIENGCKDGCK